MPIDDPVYPDSLIVEALRSVVIIALIGASLKTERPSHEVMKFRQGRRYRNIPGNPGLAGQIVLGEIARESLAALY